MNETGNPLEKIFSTDGTGDPNTMKVNYESKRIGKKDKDMKSDAFPHAEGRHDFQYSSFSVGVNTEILSGYFTMDDHSVGELPMFPDIMEQTVKMCPQVEMMTGDALYSNRKTMLNNRRVRDNATLSTKNKCNVPHQGCGIMEDYALRFR